MDDGRQAAPRQPRAPLPPRSRRRWAVAAGAAACWALLLAETGSVIAATAVLLLLAALGACCVLGLRSVGVDAGHPWVRQLAARPWRDGQDVLRLSLRHLGDVLVRTPAGALLAPVSVQLRLSPRDHASLTELMDIGLVSSSAAEVYEDEVAARGARFAGPGPAEVHVISDPSVPPGRYALRQGRPAAAAAGPLDGPPDGRLDGPGPGHDGRTRPHDGRTHPHDGRTRAEVAQARTVVTHLPTAAEQVIGLPTAAEPLIAPVPPLTLVTAGLVTQTRVSGACAGRGAAELVLPDVPTVSREHARFTFADGQWWVANLGRNGLTLNGVPVRARHVVRDGDLIRWGRAPDAPASRVGIG